MPSGADIVEWLQDPENLIPKVLLPLALATVLWFAAKARGFAATVGRLAFGWARTVRTPIEEQLAGYRERLDARTFKVHHAWMKEGQSLANILVPVIVDSDAIAGGVEDWSTVLVKFFAHVRTGPRRLAVVGGPGSGKSVALKVAAREAWKLPAGVGEATLVPILLTFGDYRMHEFDLVKAACASLRDSGFAPPAKQDGGDGVREFVAAGLASGRVIVIVDALDELELDDRKRAADRLVAELGRYERAPAILSCRTAAWRGQFADLAHETIHMAGFTSAAIHSFVKHWDFAAPKSDRELLEIIAAQPHLSDLARSPLMLTIIAFLYSQPKYHLPENRATFYDTCARALLEEWDHHRNPARANQFDRHHKENVLAALAYRHLAGDRPEADLDERPTLDVIAEVMKADSLKPSENLQMLQELCEKSGLLLRLPPSGLRFPHQTFLEFFAALRLSSHEDQEVLLEHYERDPERWREVLLLYVGLSTHAGEVARVIEWLREKGDEATALAALADARAIEPTLARGIIEFTAASLTQGLAGGRAGTETENTITLLGHVASNARTAHADLAAVRLRELLRLIACINRVPGSTIEAALLAALRRPTAETSTFVVDHLEDLRLGHILPFMGARAFILSAKIIGDAGLSLNKKREWIDGLRRARGVQPLFEIMMTSKLDSVLHDDCVLALAQCSGTDEFRAFLSTVELPLELEVSDHVAKVWGWPFEDTPNPGARRLMMYLAGQVASRQFGEVEWEGADNRLRYLAAALRIRSGRPTEGLAPISCMTNSYWRSLCSIWRKCGGSNKWRRWIEGEYGSMSMTVAAVLGHITVTAGFYVTLFSTFAPGNVPTASIVAQATIIILMIIAAIDSCHEELFIVIVASVFWWMVIYRMARETLTSERSQKLISVGLSVFLISICLTLPNKPGIQAILIPGAVLVIVVMSIGAFFGGAVLPPLLGNSDTVSAFRLLHGNDRTTTRREGVLSRADA